MKPAGSIETLKKDDSVPPALFADLEISGIGLFFEEEARNAGYLFVAGLDEVGRGCIAGPVVAAACILDPAKTYHKKLDDSKKLTPELRQEIAAELRETCVAYSIGQIEADEIDKINILEATKKAMLAAIASLEPSPDFLLIDALRLKQCPLPQRDIVRGDSISASIAAASILAKTYRDDLMCKYHKEYPQYGFSSHKGYGSSVHWDALREHGPCPIHRMSFHGVLTTVAREVAIIEQMS
ncbi:MAG TPA: ribonuclease HII [Pyrinomonadaceae bacterium]|jgi:ribonuclease HII|nr:ribonuclease HII [Pyrinomonadaceae bacterium]